MTTLSHVVARFGGRTLRFELTRDRATVDALEARLGSIGAAKDRFLAGTWTMPDVRAILALAHPGELQPPMQLSALRTDVTPLWSLGDAPAEQRRGVPDAVIDRVLEARPLATYAPLALKILLAAFAGLHPALASFDEDAEITVMPAATEERVA